MPCNRLGKIFKAVTMPSSLYKVVMTAPAQTLTRLPNNSSLYKPPDSSRVVLHYSDSLNPYKSFFIFLQLWLHFVQIDPKTSISRKLLNPHHTSVEHSHSTPSQRCWLLRQRLLPWRWPILGAYTCPDAISTAMAVGVATADATAPASWVLNAVHGAYHRAGCCWWCLRTYNYKRLLIDVE
jgi:hypothetical protein